MYITSHSIRIVLLSRYVNIYNTMAPMSKSKKVVDETIEWLRNEYEVIFEDGTGEMKVHRGKVHEYLGMQMDFSHKGKVHLTMPKHLEDIQVTYDAAQAKFNDDFIEVKRRPRSKNQLTPAPIESLLSMRSARSYRKNNVRCSTV